jgi:hypothetical protein
MRFATLFLLVCLLGPAARGEDDPVKAYLTGIGKSFAGGTPSAISGRFPEKGKIELRLKRIEGGSFRKAQAKSVLATYFKAISPSACELSTVKGLVGRYKFTYKVTATGTTVESALHVNLRKEGESWLIVGIVES